MYTGHFSNRETNYSKKNNPQNKTDAVFTDFAKCINEHDAYERKVPIKWVKAF